MPEQEYQSNSISRSEYEAFVRGYDLRHAELRLETKELETSIKADVLLLSTKIEALTLQLAKRSVDAWKLLAASSVSLILGYVLYYLQHVLVR
jgi:hypothetical protein